MQADPTLWWLTVIGSISTAAAATGTLLALVFMYLQLREMSVQTRSLEKSIRSSTYQAIVNAEMNLWETAEKTPQILNEIYDHGLDLDNDTVKSIMIGLSFYENLLYQHEQGTFPEEMWVHWQRAIRDVVRTPQYRKAWKFMRPYYYGPFVELVDASIGDLQEDEGRNQPA